MNTRMSNDTGRLHQGMRALSRREFVRIIGTSASGLFLAGVGAEACGGSDGGGVTNPPETPGKAEGVVVDLQGTPQGALGRLILMYGTGKQVGVSAIPDAQGRFTFDGLAAGEYQLRFHAPGEAFVPEPYPHPQRFTVAAGKSTSITMHVQRGNYTSNLVEIYCGDDFFQLQPDGLENGEAIVKVGAVVCWYNVGIMIHSATGGPWNDTGDLQRTASYNWVASTPGLYPYHCKYHQPSMQGALRVIA